MSPTPHQARLIRAVSLPLTALLLIFTACRPAPGSPPADLATDPLEQLPPGEQPPPPFGTLTTLRTVDWPEPYGVYLVGIDRAKKRALLRLQSTRPPARFAFEWLPIDPEAPPERWTATPKLAPKLVDQYPVFRALEDPAQLDQERMHYATWLASVTPWRTPETPLLGVTPSQKRDLVLYNQPPTDGQDGDWLYLQPSAGKPRRFDLGLRASYLPSFSPSGALVAWNGGATTYALPGRQVGYRLHLRRTDHPSAPLIVLEDVPSLQAPPLWPDDDEQLVVVSKYDASRTCVLLIPRIDLPDPKPEPLWCSQGPLGVMASPDDDHILVMDQAAQKLAYIELDSRAVVWQRPFGGQAAGFGVWPRDDELFLFEDGGELLHELDPTKGPETKKRAVLPEPGSFIGRGVAQVIDDRMVLLRQKGDKVELVALELRGPQT